MASGEELHGLAPPDLYEIDGAPSPTSDYSSCDESEFEKYCSANSVLGTASVCSSFADCAEFLDLESEPLRNAQDGEDRIKEKLMFSEHARDRKSYRLYGRFDRRNLRISGSKELDRGILSRPGDLSGGEMVSAATISQNKMREWPSEQDFVDQSNLTIRIGGHHSPTSFSDKSPSPSNFYDGEADEVKELSPDCLTDKRSNCTSIQHFQSNPLRSDFLKLNQEDGDHGTMFEKFVSGKEKGTMLIDDENTYEYGNSDGEESNLDSGTDDENKIFVYSKGDSPHPEERISPLLMNSIVAFGSEDWNEFMLDRGESDPFSLGGTNPLKVAESSLRIPAKDAIYNATGKIVSFQNQTFSSDTNESMLPAMFEEQVVGMALPISVAHYVDDDSSTYRYSGAETAATSHYVEAHAKFQMDVQRCFDGNILTEKDSHSCQTVQGIDTVVAPVGVRRLFSSQDPDREHVDKAVKVFQCYSVEELGSCPEVSKEQFSGSSKTPFNSLSAARFFESIINAESQGEDTEDHGAYESSESTTAMELLMPKSDQCFHHDNLGLHEFNKCDLSESYDDMVQDMELVLLESVEPCGVIFSQVNCGALSQQSQPCRDGSSTASTSGATDVYHPKQRTNKINWIEVVGAKQKRGEVSLGEWLVGIKEYTVYIIRVWSGENQWEVERRYRDFFTLYHQLKKFFSNHGLTLPSPWSKVEAESWKLFGNASPDVINERSSLVQECLQSILYSETDIGIHGSFFWFLSHENTNSGSLLNTLASFPGKTLGRDEGALPSGDACVSGVSSLGKTISLIVEMHPKKSIKQLLEAQHSKCAGCYKHLDVKKSLMQEFAQTLGWGKPRLCEYTGQLFCSSCHSNETAILPARVLQHWDFSLFPVSQLAKAYLDSIYDKPMLCVSAVNPFLFSRVPSLLHVMGIRKKIAAMLECVRCPFHRSLRRSLGSRKYILENNDFFALRDLVDLSKGAFAALPVMMESLSKKTLEHIMQQCLICCDVGEMCGARSDCDDPSSLIFPFQESEAAHCSSCRLVFHDRCFKKLPCCPCDTVSQLMSRTDPLNDQKHGPENELGRVLDLSPRTIDSRSATSVLSNLFAKVKLENPLRPKSSPVILMGSLSSTPP